MELKEIRGLRVLLVPWVQLGSKASKEIPGISEIQEHLASQVRREALVSRVTWEG